MAVKSKSFTATGAGAHLSVTPGDGFDYSVSGTFVGTVVIEKSLSGGQAWETVVTSTAPASGSIVNRDGGSVWYRFRCTVYTSGTIVTSLTETAETLREFRDDTGATVLALKQGGVVIGDAPAGQDWVIDENGIIPGADDTMDIGNGTTDPRTVRAATSMVTPLLSEAVADDGISIDSELHVTKAEGLASGVTVYSIGEDFGIGFLLKRCHGSIDLTGVESSGVTLIDEAMPIMVFSCQFQNEEEIGTSGTTAKVAIGTAADPDRYGKTADLDPLTVAEQIGTGSALAPVAAGEDIILSGVVTDGSAYGDTGFSSGVVKVEIVYLTLGSLFTGE